jgi:hypothetical protein
MNTRIIIVAIVFTVATFCSCASGKKDCQGHRHHVKTDMGGYL